MPSQSPTNVPSEPPGSSTRLIAQYIQKATRQANKTTPLIVISGLDASCDCLDRMCADADTVHRPSSTTAAEGFCGKWRRHLSADDVAAFKRVAGDLLIEFGYETDSSWRVA